MNDCHDDGSPRATATAVHADARQIAPGRIVEERVGEIGRDLGFTEAERIVCYRKSLSSDPARASPPRP